MNNSPESPRLILPASNIPVPVVQIPTFNKLPKEPAREPSSPRPSDDDKSVSLNTQSLISDDSAHQHKSLLMKMNQQHREGMRFSSQTVEVQKALVDRIESIPLFKKHRAGLQTLVNSLLASVRNDFGSQSSDLFRNIEAYEEMTGITTVTQINAVISGYRENAHSEFHQAYSKGQSELAKALDDLYRISVQETNEFEKKKAEFAEQLESLNKEIASLRAEKMALVGAVEELEFDQVSLYDFFNPASTALELKEELAKVQSQAKELVRQKKAISVSDLIFEGSHTKGRRFASDFATAMLAAYNLEVENAIIQAKRSRDVQKAFDKIIKAKAKIEKAGSMVDADVTSRYHRLKMKELELAFKHLTRQEHEKEEQAEERRRLREEEAAKKALDREKAALEKAEREAQRALEEALAAREAIRLEALEKEGSHLEAVLSQVDPESNEKDEEILALRKRLEEVLAGKKKNADQLANMRAGYVYVISNKGSFGEGVVKIGMTRRSDPMDRVKELGDASVPFHFAVHMLHFSSDAFGLENKLHKKFAHQSVNKVNMRKEFFRVHPLEVQEAIRELAEGATISFEEDAVSVDYAESLVIEANLTKV